MDKHNQFLSYLNKGMSTRKALGKVYLPDTKEEKLEGALIVVAILTDLLFVIIPII